MKLGYTILYVENVEETIRFYENAFGLTRKFIAEGGQYGELDTGSTTLGFVRYDLAESNDVGFNEEEAKPKSPTFELAFVDSDVDAAFTHAIENGAEKVKDPVMKPWGQKLGYVKDNNGFLIEIASPMGGN